MLPEWVPEAEERHINLIAYPIGCTLMQEAPSNSNGLSDIDIFKSEEK